MTANSKTTTKSAKAGAKSAKAGAKPVKQGAKSKKAGAERHAFGAEVGSLLNLVANSLYSNRDIFLRELVSNASDACERLRWESLTQPELLDETAELAIDLETDLERGVLIVRDNGIGMEREDLIANLGNIARSGTGHFLRSLGENKTANLPELIGRFGVGFYSALMVASPIAVHTRHAKSQQGWFWQSTGGEEYEIAPDENTQDRGTEVTLHLAEDAKEYLEQPRLEYILREWCDHIAFPVRLNGKRVNSEDALWRRDKNEINEAQYESFYRHISGNLDNPWRYLHIRGEGLVSFTALLYVPTLRPFDLYDPARATHLRLYVRRIFISEGDHGLLPQWLRFVRGVVDSEDLPLNVSRETLQADKSVSHLREALTGRLLQDWESHAAQDPADFNDFWDTFGAIIKEGIYEDEKFRSRLLALARFTSTHTLKADDTSDKDATRLTSLADYSARMTEGQEAIWYLTGDEISRLAQNPRLEGLTARGEEVLLLTDGIDEFWPQLFGTGGTGGTDTFMGKPLRSVSEARADTSSDKPEDPQDSEANPQVQDLVKRLNDSLAGAVKEVRLSQSLRQSAVCLVAGTGDMDFNLERMLRLNNKLDTPPLRILEINPTHPLITRLAEAPVTKGESFGNAAHTLLELARIAEYGAPSDPVRFASAITDLLGKSL